MLAGATARRYVPNGQRRLQGLAQDRGALRVESEGDLRGAMILELRSLDGRSLQSTEISVRKGVAAWSLGNLHGAFLARLRSENGPGESRLLVAP